MTTPTHEQAMRAEQARQIRQHLEKYRMKMDPEIVERYEKRLAVLEGNVSSATVISKGAA